MSLKRRNIIASILLLLAAVCWTFGRQMFENHAEGNISASIAAAEYRESTEAASLYSTEIAEMEYLEDTTADPNDPIVSPDFSVPEKNVPETDYRVKRLSGIILFFVALASSCIAFFVFFQKNPVFGPDGISLLFALYASACYIFQSMEYTIWISSTVPLTILYRIVCTFFILTGVRELLGWIRSRFSLSWCLVHRTASRITAPQISLMILVGWILFSLAGVTCCLAADRSYPSILFCIWGYLITAIWGFLCLWKYGTDLNHFKKQLDNYQQGKPIIVGDGAFSQTEAQLLDVQAQHEEAIHTAVTSERFKVELISNVSHDLRTPLTSILGYSELLQKETLSPEGQEQLLRLHQKAGYMNDLVESLFELTKVSSGVVESKKEEIDLVRLLEQTIGLFDDQLVSAGLTVRRNYAADSIPIITDGSRMHQVFANLLGNAIKYALEGTRIYLDVREKEDCFLIRVMNTASYEMDFEPDEIMQRFARGDKARTTKGSGLGLAIARTYTESVGGTFRIAVDGDQFSAITELPKTERNF
ncbi:MAG: sensor histidine kinase [Lachnospiraceae bacterium]